WVHQPGTCPPTLEGAVFGRAGDACGGSGTSFDTTQIYGHSLIRDEASPTAPCESGRTSGLCYRMWYQGIDSSNRLFIGYALSPDGRTWTRVPGPGTNGSVIGEGPTGTFDAQNAAIAAVVKDGLRYRMWYSAQDGSGAHRIGHVVSLDGVNWVRPVPNDPVWSGSDDPGTLSPDNVWSPFVLKEGLSYRMWYNHTTRENSRRVGLAAVTPGTPLSAVGLSGVGTVYTVTFTTAATIPADGYVLVTLPAAVAMADVSAIDLSGFGAGATLTVADGILTDADAGGDARSALLVRLSAAAAPGPKSITFAIATPPAADTTVLVQTFDSREVLEYATVTIIGSGISPTPTPIPPTATPTPINSPTPAPTNTATPTLTPPPSGNNQPWSFVAGSCASGAIFGIAGSACGGGGTSFDADEIFPPSIVFDEASALRPCENGRTSGFCYRMWYVGVNNPIEGIRRIGYAVSPDGITWTRVPGPLAGGAMIRASEQTNQFDTTYVVAPSVLVDEASPIAPCENGRTSGECHRMWFEGVRTSPSYVFRIGYAVSPDGINWTRIAAFSDGSVVQPGPFRDFDDNNVGVPMVIKDGAIYRMWFEANQYDSGYTVGYLVSTDGRNWTRAEPNTPVWTGAMDTIDMGSPDEVWAVRALKEGSSYRLYYATSTRPNSRRFALAEMTPGTPLSVSVVQTGTTYTLVFTTDAIPAG
ncbi:MAG: hypothetical protein ACK44M_08600, partial [Chloroflexus sp.]